MLKLALLLATFPGLVQADRWAVIAAGSKGWWNYRHQADACHAYQVLKKSGIPEDHIITMMQDDVANSSENPLKGQLYNKPGDDAVDVRAGCNIDYSGDIVTGALFTGVITGNESAVPANGKVLKSGPNDDVFIYFVDHGGAGIVSFPNGPFYHATQLSMDLEAMQNNTMFNTLIFYMEACYSGSMFTDLPTNGNGRMLALTAANAKESSWGYYCMDADVHGKDIGTCLGDLFSISWMEDSDAADLSTETFKTQIDRVVKRTNKSHVLQFGDTSVESLTLGTLESKLLAAPHSTIGAPSQSNSMKSRDVPSMSAWRKYLNSLDETEKEIYMNLYKLILEGQEADENVFKNIAKNACRVNMLNQMNCEEYLLTAREELKEKHCHYVLASTIDQKCPARSEHNPGGWNHYNMQFSQVLVNVCNKLPELMVDLDVMQQVVELECRMAAAAVRELVV